VNVARLHIRRLGLAHMSALAWFGVFGGPAAWALQFLFGMQFGLARCESPDARFQFPTLVLSAVLGAAGVAVAIVAELAAFAVFRATRDTGDSHDPEEIRVGRLHFLGAVGMTVNPLVLAICAMVAVAVPLLGLCHQS
jgi:hypothetical protein